jgi:hypothetical protein
MARIEDGSQPHTRLERHDHDSVHLVVDNVTNLSKVDRVDDFIIPILLVTIKVFSLTTVTCVPSAALRQTENIQPT